MRGLCTPRLYSFRRPLSIRLSWQSGSGAAAAAATQRRMLCAAGGRLLLGGAQRPLAARRLVTSHLVALSGGSSVQHRAFRVGHAWVKKPGDVCGPGDVLCEIETDKATVAFEVQDECVLAKILVQPGKEIKVGDPVALSVEDEAAYHAFVEMDKAGKVATPANASAATPDAPAAAAPSPAAAPSSSSTAAATVDLSSLGDFAMSPAARHHLENHKVELRGVNGSGYVRIITHAGKDGRITKGDVLLAIQNGQVVAKGSATAAAAAPKAASIKAPAAAAPIPASAPVEVTIPEILAAPGTYKDTKNTNMRRVIARRLAESKATVPHAYETVDCEIDAVLAFRKRLQKDYEVNVSVNDVIIRSAALALRDVPEANAFWDSKKSVATVNPNVDISVAVATPAGLITPIITASDRRGLTSISAKMKDLAGRARIGKLKPEEFQGGSFTISNLGMFGIDEFSAVINPPQACIMAVGRGSKKVRAPAYKEGQKAKELKPYVSTVMTATLSFDRRVIDEAIAAQFLQVFKSYVSKPELLML